ncbi:transmembrane signal receptor [Lithospermum erythrorhizon]|uniref:Transmembrane signal receptor n=1 Tax=Lithospermum erythrorhizon TaxID=34254 RepID=A0AAV3R4V3_LITER
MHILETARSLIFQSNLPVNFWGDCILTATYLVYRFPLPSLQHETPFECYFHKAPSYDHLRSFGCLCFASAIKVGKSKFDIRANSWIFVIYPFGKKAYKVLFDLTTKTVLYSRDVKFHEHCFPYHNQVLPTNLPLPTLPHEYLCTIFYHVTDSHASNDSLHSISTELVPKVNTQSSSESIPPDMFTPHDNSIDVPSSFDLPMPRRSNRVFNRPKHLDEYVCYGVKSSLAAIISDFSYSFLHYPFIASVLSLNDPTTYVQIVKDPRRVSAMDKELVALVANGTWEYMPLHSHKKSISCKWVYKIKLESNGSIEIRVIIIVAAYKGWILSLLDVNNAFYMVIWWKSKHQGNGSPKLNEFLLKQGYKQSKNDYSLYIKNSEAGIVITVVYVDDIFVRGSDNKAIVDLKATLHSKFNIKDLGSLHYFLGFEIGYTVKGTIMSQRKFVGELIQASGISSIQSTHYHVTPLTLHLKLTPDEGELLTDVEYYRSMVGKLNFLTNTRPDMSYSIQTLSQFMQAPRTSHLQALHHLLSYVNKTIGQGILLKDDQALQLAISSPQSLEALLRLGIELWLRPRLSSALHIAKNLVFHERTKCIDMDCHFTREKVLEELLQLAHIPTK